MNEQMHPATMDTATYADVAPPPPYTSTGNTDGDNDAATS